MSSNRSYTEPSLNIQESTIKDESYSIMRLEPDFSIIQKIREFMRNISHLYYEYLTSFNAQRNLLRSEEPLKLFFELLIKTLFFPVITFIACLGEVLGIGGITISIIINIILESFYFITRNIDFTSDGDILSYRENRIRQLENIQNEINEQSLQLENYVTEQLNSNILQDDIIDDYFNELERQEQERQRRRNEEIDFLRSLRHNQVLRHFSRGSKRTPTYSTIDSNKYFKHGGSILNSKKLRNSSERSVEKLKILVNCLILSFLYEFKKLTFLDLDIQTNKINSSSSALLNKKTIDLFSFKHKLPEIYGSIETNRKGKPIFGSLQKQMKYKKINNKIINDILLLFQDSSNKSVEKDPISVAYVKKRTSKSFIIPTRISKSHTKKKHRKNSSRRLRQMSRLQQLSPINSSFLFSYENIHNAFYKFIRENELLDDKIKEKIIKNYNILYHLPLQATAKM